MQFVKKKTKRKSNIMVFKDFSENKYYKNSDDNLFKVIETVHIFNKIEEKDYNVLPYSQAIKLDNRNIIYTFYSLLKMKIEIISIFFYPEEFTHKSLTLSIYVLDFLFSFFINALLYTDDIVSEKYHNNGQLNLFTTLFLALTSNIISCIIMFYIKKIVSYREYLSTMVKNVNKKSSYIITFQKLFLVLKIKIFFFFNISFILSIFITLYLLIFCQIYKKSQGSLLINYLMSLIESLSYSVGISLLICILRFLGLKYKLKYIYRTSVFIDDKF